MLKNTQSKIILIICITELLIIAGLGIFSINTLNEINNTITPENIKEMHEAIVNDTGKIQIYVAIATITAILIAVCISIFLSKYIMYPVNKLIESAEEITSEESNKETKNSESDEKKNKKERKKKKKINTNLENVIDTMTIELKDKLSEVSTQKNQIETILLHMTDGIIAFNMEGEIILINPAAKKFLSIGPEDNTFEDIFKKFELDINMEKIIYLENWTSTEQRIQVEDRYVNVFFAPFKDEKERPDGVISVIQDITEHVKLDNMQKEFVADVSHELKTPITSIMGYADTLLEGGYDEETKVQFLNVIASESRRMARLVTDLLT